MARKIENNPLLNVEEERAALGINSNTLKKAAGRPRHDDIVRDNAAQAGLTADWTRATFIMKTALLDKMKDYAYTERISLKEAMDMALEQFLKDKKNLLPHRK